MSYVVLARKYRPRSFEEMVGQDHVVRALTHALEQGRLHHAYLFTGTRGIGKTTVSRILAKSLNCTGPDGQGGITARPCGVCSACREIDADRYIDYVELDAASNRSIDEIRELIERAAYKPTVGRFKVFMIDEAHQLTKDAFNALLKTLEEPPEYLKFVLATTDPEKMLPTVLSRCLQFNLRPMAPQTVGEHLTRVLEAEQVPVEPGALRLLSRAARGSMRDALSLTDQAIAYGGGQLQEASVRAMLGTVDRRHAERLVQALAARDGRSVLAEVDGLRDRGLSAAGTLEELARLLQQMAVEQAVPGALDETDPDTEAGRRLAAALASDETQLLYSMAVHGRAELPLAPDEYAGLAMVLLRFLAFPSTEGGTARSAAPASRSSAPLVAPAAAASVAVPVAAPRAAQPLTPTPPSAVPAKAPAAPTSPGASAPVQAAARPAAEAATAAPAAVAAPAPAARTPVVAAPQPVPQAASVPARAAAVRPVAADEPPPWMDEAPFEGEVVARPTARSPRSADPEPEPAPDDVPDDPQDAAPWPEEVAAAPAPAMPARRALPEVARTPLGDRWAEAVAGMQATGSLVALVRELALQSELVAIAPGADGQGEQWQLRVEREPLRAPPLVDKLQKALQAWAAQPIRLQTVAGVAQDSPALRETERLARRQREAEEVIQSDPLVQSLLAQFSTARIVPGSIRPV
ncbi:DNA polymerase III subunit gamma/tau [Ideonella oryzae]|uniref:DNA polymerase III subunit gamma/tau n=1 Tax=Ideonella oryzae TaxID=2937441 RepID=A0ABT1BP33_9BURK|nr:DNA polymerase III subunit gamma/tau [Ideonella oryzae]MCO5977878.1 DNA polymerase III subunit gamma/tau [Ideonella oryzae]